MCSVRLIRGIAVNIGIDKSAANSAALKEETGQKIEIRQIKYLNNLVEKNHRSIKRIV
jgi:putative transposase